LLNTISVELFKMWKNKIFGFCLLVVIGITLMQLQGISPGRTDLEGVFFSLLMSTFYIHLLMSGIILTVLFQREYQDNTLINMLTAPTGRIEFVLSKLIAWFLWHIITLMLSLFALGLWSHFILSETFPWRLVIFFILLGCTSFVTALPLLLLAIKQRRAFYPTILMTMVLVFLQSQILEHNPIFAAFAIHFLDSSGVSPQVETSMIVMTLASVLAFGLVSIIGACVSFSRQDQ